MIQYQSLPISSPEGNQFATLDVAVFFHKQLIELCNQFGYTQKQYEQYLSWHQPGELVEKIDDPDRFFRVIRDNHGKIIAYMESHLTDTKIPTHTIQWVFVSDEYRKNGIARELWTIFFEYCGENNIYSVISVVKENNSRSIRMHEELGFTLKSVDIGGNNIYNLIVPLHPLAA